MKYCIIRSEEIICSTCLKVIGAGSEAFRFYNRTKSKRPIRKGYIQIPNAQIHFRHVLCQYNRKKRKLPFNEWINQVKHQLSVAEFSIKMKKKNLSLKQLIESS